MILSQDNPLTAGSLRPLDIPGWSQPLHAEFDSRESSIIPILRTASFKINRETTPSAYPTPSAPPGAPFFVPGSANAINWQSAPWASSYDLILRDRTTGHEHGRRQVWDCTKEGQLELELGPELNFGAPRESLVVVLVGRGVDGQYGPEGQPLYL